MNKIPCYIRMHVFEHLQCYYGVTILISGEWEEKLFMILDLFNVPLY